MSDISDQHQCLARLFWIVFILRTPLGGVDVPFDGYDLVAIIEFLCIHLLRADTDQKLFTAFFVYSTHTHHI